MAVVELSNRTGYRLRNPANNKCFISIETIGINGRTLKRPRVQWSNDLTFTMHIGTVRYNLVRAIQTNLISELKNCVIEKVNTVYTEGNTIEGDIAEITEQRIYKTVAVKQKSSYSLKKLIDEASQVALVEKLKGTEKT